MDNKGGWWEKSFPTNPFWLFEYYTVIAEKSVLFPASLYPSWSKLMNVLYRMYW